ncbi:unnamed protein product [Caenorhabditis auriculariae]|uniref:Uncharacterized protein n=1 Tax=Caenorhabditis auriculariae TaxID=2777116 RepID=A0A8S1H0B3_9PELO|nr:unnamed protein product [Caenorhabditis auriculariae]
MASNSICYYPYAAVLWIWSKLTALFYYLFNPSDTPLHAVRLTRIESDCQKVPFLKDALHDDICGESLDRRGWSGRTSMAPTLHPLHGRMSSSSHNLSTRLSGSSQNLNIVQNAYGFNVHQNPSDTTAPQRIANLLSRPFRTNPLKRTKSVSKMEKGLLEANQNQLLHLSILNFQLTNMYNRSFRVPNSSGRPAMSLASALLDRPSGLAQLRATHIALDGSPELLGMQCLSPNREKNVANPRLVRGRIVYKSKR